MKKYEVIAQSNDAVVMTVEAEDIFQAAEAVAESFNVEIDINPARDRLTFETANDYYDLRPAE